MIGATLGIYKDNQHFSNSLKQRASRVCPKHGATNSQELLTCVGAANLILASVELAREYRPGKRGDACQLEGDTFARDKSVAG